MKQVKYVILTLAILLFFLIGCGRDDKIYFESNKAHNESVGTEVTLTQQKIDADENTEVEKQEEVFSDNEEGTEETNKVLGKCDCFVYICGAVVNTGVYELPQGSRVCDVIAMAGGMTKDASEVSVNQAELVTDGQMIFIPTIEEASAGIGTDILMKSTGNSLDESVEDTKVNINTASAEQLMTLSGVGQSRADSIIAYRKEHGGFLSIEEIMNVDGIKEGLYNRIRDDIRVK